MKHETQTRCYEVRAADKPLTLTGVAVVFNQPADLGSIKEVIAPDALRGLDLNDIVLITNHDGGQIPLARSPKTLSLTVTEQGLEMSAELPDTEQARTVGQFLLQLWYYGENADTDKLQRVIDCLLKALSAERGTA